MEALITKTKEELIAMLYNYVCYRCLTKVEEYNGGPCSSDYWGCNGCERKCCNDCRDDEWFNNQKGDDDDYYCLICEKQHKNED